MAVDAHRPGPWKQQNKAHKHGRHRSKGAIDEENRGRVPLKIATKKVRRELHRAERRHRVEQIRSKKREDIIAKKRALGSRDSPPFLVAVVALSSECNSSTVLDAFQNCDEEAVVTHSLSGCVHISLPRFKQRFSFIAPSAGDMYAILDAAKVADTILLLYPSEDLNAKGKMLLSILLSQGLPSTVHVVQGLEEFSAKRQTEAKKLVQKFVELKFPKEKVFSLDSSQNALLVLRQIGNQKQRKVLFRDKRFNLLAESIDFEKKTDQDPLGTLKVSGYARGKSVDVNGLVHIPGWGDFQMHQIDKLPDPHALLLNSSRNERLIDDAKVLQVCDITKQVSLASENVVDYMEGEQTWPTEEELKEAEETRNTYKKKVPKGMSQYQAAWILEENEEKESAIESSASDDDDEIVMEDLEAMEEAESNDEDANEESGDGPFDSATVTDIDDKETYDDKINIDEENEELQKFKEARMYEMFPDEVDTPIDVPARYRYQKFRGLKSFRTTFWDPKENLPTDYARIFQFENYDRARKRYLSEKNENNDLVGSYITIHISNVPENLIERQGTMPLVIYGLLPHEQKMSVLNFAIKRVPEDVFPIRSKDDLIFHVGYRRFSTRPVFSQHTNGNKHLYEKFLRPNLASVATVFAPIIYSPASVLVFREEKDGQHTLVATGSVLSVNPDRIIAKRIILSGHPFKINRKAATIRYMFFNKEDINWFKPVELHTKLGRRGHIKESLGTHGHMKCLFDKPMKSQDIALMNLYKRIFPKWCLNSQVNPPSSIFTVDTDMEC